MRLKIGTNKISTNKIGTKIIAGYVVVLVLLLILTVFSYTGLLNLEKTMDELVSSEMNKVNETNQFRFNLSQEIAFLRGYAITHDEGMVKKYYDASNASNKILLELINTEQTEELSRLVDTIIQYNGDYNTVATNKFIPLIKIKKFEEATAIMTQEMEPLADKAFNAAQELIDYRMNKMSEKTAAVTSFVHKTIKLITIFSLITVLLGLGTAIVITRLITKPVKLLAAGAQAIAQGDLTKQVMVRSKDEIGDLAQSFNKMAADLRGMVKQVIETAQNLALSSQELSASSEETTAASNQIATSIEQLAAGAENQAKSAEEVSTVINQMSASTRQVANNAISVNQISTRAVDAAKAGVVQANNAIDKIEQVRKVSNQMSVIVKDLGEASKQIGEIVDVIKGIANQTNLLALNAAIEAARAGEQGRGFAVVAEEVRKLAEESADSAEKIEVLIGNIQKEAEQAVTVMEEGTTEVAAGVDAVNKAGEAFNAILAEIEKVVSEIQQVSAAAQQMASGTEIAVDSVSNIAAVSQQTAASTEEISAAAEEQNSSLEAISKAAQDLANLAEQLQKLCLRFTV